MSNYIALRLWSQCPTIMHGDEIVSLFHNSQNKKRIVRPCSSGVHRQIDRRFWFSSSGVLEREETACPDRELPLCTADTYPQTLACGLPFEGACLFLTFLVNLPWEHCIPSSWSTVCAQTVWDDAEDINHFNVIQGSNTLILKVNINHSQKNVYACRLHILVWHLEVRLWFRIPAENIYIMRIVIYFLFAEKPPTLLHCVLSAACLSRETRRSWRGTRHIFVTQAIGTEQH